RLGEHLREADIEAFEYESARDPRDGINVALFTPRALVSKRPQGKEAWLCETSESLVRFSGRERAQVLTFPLSLFTVAGKLPQPAP
ncbi:MAG: RES domain-containing protein, partial [Gammaproteobacteria bacterium]